MALVPWRGKRATGKDERPRARLRDDDVELFRRFFDEVAPGAPEGGGWSETRFPRLDLTESDDDVTVTFELPGVNPKDVEVDLAEQVLTVRGQTQRTARTRQRNVHRTECFAGCFRRSIRLPASIDPERVESRFRDGVLTITLGKRADAKPRRIPVKS